MLASVQTAMKQARENPNDFEAQLTAAKLEYQIGRHDQAIEYLLAANKITSHRKASRLQQKAASPTR